MAPIQISLMAIALSACLPMPKEKSRVSLTDTPSSNAMPISLLPQSSSPLVQALFEAPTVARSLSAAIAAKAQVRIVTTEKSSKVDLSGSTGLTGENNHSTKGAAAATVKAYKLLYDNGQTDRSILLSELAAQSALRDAEIILDETLQEVVEAYGTRSAAKEIQQQLGRMSERDQVQYQGGLKGSAPQGVYGSLETSQDVMGDAPLGGLSSSKETMRGMMERGNVLASGIPQTSTVVPGPTDPITGDYRPFVSNKGREIGALLTQAQEKKVAAPTLKQIAGDALNLLNPFKGEKIDPREQQIRRDVDRTLGSFTPEQKETEVRRRLGQ